MLHTKFNIYILSENVTFSGEKYNIQKQNLNSSTMLRNVCTIRKINICSSNYVLGCGGLAEKQLADLNPIRLNSNPIKIHEKRKLLSNINKEATHFHTIVRESMFKRELKNRRAIKD